MNRYEVTGTATMATATKGRQSIQLNHVVVPATDEPAAIRAALLKSLDGRISATDLENITWFKPPRVLLLKGDQLPMPVFEATPAETMLDPKVIRTNGGTQARAATNQAKVDEYAERMVEGDKFPAVTVYFDGTDYWLGDGFHRLSAHWQAFTTPGRPGTASRPIAAHVKQGTRRDAVLHACGANYDHGLPRTREDKERAVHTLLEDKEWGGWSDREIARRCHVSPTYVGKLRAAVTVHVDSENDGPPLDRSYIDRYGNTATMNTVGLSARRLNQRGGLTKAEYARKLVPELVEFLRTYTDKHGRTWREIQSVAAHTNSTPWQDITKEWNQRKIYYEDDVLKEAIELAFEVLNSSPAETPPAEKSADFDECLRRALHRLSSAAARWQERRARGLTDEELKVAIGEEFGTRDNSFGPGSTIYTYEGGEHPEFHYNSWGHGKPSLEGAALVKAARELLQIPYPSDTAAIPPAAPPPPPPLPQPDYASINTLESHVRAWLEKQPEDHLAVMERIKSHRGQGGHFSALVEQFKANPTTPPFRVGDLWQACNNTFDQLRQRAAQRQPQPEQPPTAVAPLAVLAEKLNALHNDTRLELAGLFDSIANTLEHRPAAMEFVAAVAGVLASGNEE